MTTDLHALSITCPRCGRTSHNTTDAVQGYCGACHDWTSQNPCPACQGPTGRETTGMVCRTCGRDYAPEARPTRRSQTFALEPVRGGALGLTTMTASGCLPCHLAMEQGIGQYATPPAATSPDVAADAPSAVTTTATWAGVIGMEGVMTGDARLIEPGALRWENLPIPLRYVSQDVGGHDGAVVVGRILTIERGAGGRIEATGDFDLGSPSGREAERLVREGLVTGVSMDLDDVSFEVRVAAEVIAELEAMWDDDAPPPEPPPPNDDGTVTVATINADDEVRVTTDARVRASTVVAVPAFAEANIALTSDPVATDTIAATSPDVGLALVAGAAPVAPPVAWFNDPHLSEATPLTVTPDGRLYGHMALWGTCHATHTGRGQCVSPPHSASGYAHFRVGSVLTDEGAEIATGRITLDTRHAGPTLSAEAAVNHYDDTGYAVADVVAGEDEFGVWLAGALRPGTTPEQVRSLRASPLSGDWRRTGTDLELVAVLAVNVPGFPVPRPSGRVAGGVVRSLVASGMLAPRLVRAPAAETLSADDLRYLRRLADRERAEEAAASLAVLDVAADLARRVRAVRVHTFARTRTTTSKER